MTVSTRPGRVVRHEHGVRLEFARRYEVAVDEVWAAVTAPDQLVRWFGSWTGDPARGAVEVRMSAEEGAEPQLVTIEECHPPRRLSVTVPSEDGPWPLAVTLQERSGGTDLHFVHRLAEPYDASSIGPGWQFYLDRLGAVVEGGPVPDAWDEYFPSLSELYAMPEDPGAP